MGFDAAAEELASPKSKAAGVILASDVSAKTEKEVRFAAGKAGREVVKADFSMDDAKETVGKRVGVFVILDGGLYGSIKKHIVTP